MTKVDGNDGLTCGVPIADLAVNWDAERSQEHVPAIIDDHTDSDRQGALHTVRTSAVTDYETLSWTSTPTASLTLTLDRPDAAQRVHLTWPTSSSTVVPTAPADDDVRAIVVTGSGRAFCAGMDLSVAGNVFGLDESLAADARDLRRAARRPGRTDDGRPRHRRPRHARDLRLHQAGDRRDQRPRGRHRRHDDPGHGRPAGLDQRSRSASSSARSASSRRRARRGSCPASSA